MSPSTKRRVHQTRLCPARACERDVYHLVRVHGVRGHVRGRSLLEPVRRDNARAGHSRLHTTSCVAPTWLP